jgi:hypothetical protein
MKICPSCRQTYTDDDLNFCLTDGSFLTAFEGNEPKTVYMDQPRITNQTNWEQQGVQPPAVWGGQQGIQQQQSNFPVQFQSQNQTLPTISLVLGILGILTICCYGSGVFFGIAAVITGVIGMNQEKNDPQTYSGRGMAIGGIVTGAISLLIGFGFLILLIIGNL